MICHGLKDLVTFEVDDNIYIEIANQNFQDTLFHPGTLCDSQLLIHIAEFFNDKRCQCPECVRRLFMHYLRNEKTKEKRDLEKQAVDVLKLCPDSICV